LNIIKLNRRNLGGDLKLYISVLVITVALIYFCIFAICNAAKCADVDLERLNELKEKNEANRILNENEK
jgi:uncharacterized protein YoxC